MGLLNEESLNEAFKSVAQEVEADSPTEPVVEEVVEATPSEEVVEETPQPESEKTEPVEEPIDEGHIIPYTRFKKVVGARNDLRSENETLKARMQQMEEQYKNLQTPNKGSVAQENDPWWKEYANDSATEPEVSSDYSGLEARLHKFEVQQAQGTLRNEIAEAQKNYPTVPQEVLLQAVIQDPSTKIDLIARQYHEWVSHIQDEAIASHRQGANLVETKVETKEAPARVAGKSKGSTRSLTTGAESKPKNLAEAGDALHNFLKKNSIF